MTPKPTKFPDWASVPQVDPISGGQNIVEPPDSQKETGWLYKQKPPSSWWNWIANLTSQWIHYFEENFGDIPDVYATKVGVRNTDYIRRTAVETSLNNYNIVDPDLDFLDGMQLKIIIPVITGNVNSGAVTLGLNGLYKPLISYYCNGDQPLNGYEISHRQYYDVIYNGTIGAWELLTFGWSTATTLNSGSTTNQSALLVRPKDVTSYVNNSITTLPLGSVVFSVAAGGTITTHSRTGCVTGTGYLSTGIILVSVASGTRANYGVLAFAQTDDDTDEDGTGMIKISSKTATNFILSIRGHLNDQGGALINPPLVSVLII